MGEKRKKAQPRLTTYQRDILTLLYRFRFITSQGLAAYRQQPSSVAAHERLTGLMRRGYVARHFDSSYRLQHRPAEYYLLPAAIRLLRTILEESSERELKQIYARPRASRRFIDRSLRLLTISLAFERVYRDQLDFMTKVDLNLEAYTYLPQPLPDAFFRVSSEATPERSFFVEYFDSGVSIGIHGRKIAEYLDYQDEGGWEETGEAFPTVIIICETTALLNQAAKRVRSISNQKWGSVTFRLIDLPSLTHLARPNEAAWLDPEEREMVEL